MNLVFIYFENPKMLQAQIRIWETYHGLPVKVILVDDCSVQSPASSVIQKCRPSIPFELYRIDEKIPWNMSGARNVGCLNSSGWIFVSDMDTTIDRENLERLIEAATDHSCCYWPAVILHPTFMPMQRTKANLAFHRKLFDLTGGYDEDYAGNYLREDQDFFERVQRFGILKPVDNVIVRFIPDWMVEDASTIGLPRDKEKNTALLIAKRRAGYPKPVTSLRFKWSRLI